MNFLNIFFFWLLYVVVFFLEINIFCMLNFVFLFFVVELVVIIVISFMNM